MLYVGVGAAVFHNIGLFVEPRNSNSLIRMNIFWTPFVIEILIRIQEYNMRILSKKISKWNEIIYRLIMAQSAQEKATHKHKYW